jgi:hypothetical protein
MKHLLLLLAVVVTFSFTAVAQTGGSDTQTPATGAEDMSTWSSAAKSPTKKERKTQQSATKSGSAASGEAADAKGGGQGALTGCLAAGQEEGKFILSTARDKGIAVTPDAGVDLKPHVGHKVKLTGKWEKSVGAGEKETAQDKAGGRNFTAAKVDHIAAECKAQAGAKPKEGAGR